MFRGKYPHTIDPKGRLSIPVKFRDELAERKVFTLVLTEGDQCIWAFPLDEWERFESRLRQQPQFATQTRHFMRITVGSARDCPVDRALRTQLDERNRKLGLELASLRAFARVDSAARKLGLTEPTKDQVQLAREFLAPDAQAGGVAFRAAQNGTMTSPRGRP